MSEIFFEDNDSFEDKISQWIINGKPVRITDYPFYVYIDSEHCYCGGALLSQNTVLTAAHCVAKSSLSKIKIIPGLHCRTQQKRTTCYPRKVIVHPKYKRDKTYDIALMYLQSPVNICTCVDTIEVSDCIPKVGEKVTVVGYGYTSCDEQGNGKCKPTPSKYLRASDRKIVGYDGPIMNTFSKQTRTCFGDSGSPVIYNGELSGIHVGGEWLCGCTSYHVTLGHPKIRSFLTEYICCDI